MMNCAECGEELNPFGCLLAYIPDEEQYQEFCEPSCHEKYLQRYPKYSVRQLEKIKDWFIRNYKVSFSDNELDKFFELIKDKKKVEEILNGIHHTELGKSKKKKESTRRSRLAS